MMQAQLPPSDGQGMRKFMHTPNATFGGVYSYGWPTIAKWHSLLSEYQVPNHFHLYVGNTCFTVRRYCFHAVINQGVCISFAKDDFFNELDSGTNGVDTLF